MWGLSKTSVLSEILGLKSKSVCDHRRAEAEAEVCSETLPARALGLCLTLICVFVLDCCSGPGETGAEHIT